MLQHQDETINNIRAEFLRTVTETSIYENGIYSPELSGHAMLLRIRDRLGAATNSWNPAPEWDALHEHLRYFLETQFPAHSRNAHMQTVLTTLLDTIATAYEVIPDSDLDDEQPRSVSLTLREIRFVRRLRI